MPLSTRRLISHIVFFKAANKKELSGVIYVGHLPYGFVEEGLKNYFEQYGEVLRVKLMRSKRTARSKGFGFVEFVDREVAEIAVKSMNGYMMFGTRLECRLLEKSEEHGNLFIRSNKKFKFVPWHVIYQKNMNRVRNLTRHQQTDSFICYPSKRVLFFLLKDH